MRIRPLVGAATDICWRSARIGTLSPIILLGEHLDWFPPGFSPGVIQFDDRSYGAPETLIGALLCLALGILVITLMMHAARGIVRGHARLAKALLVEPGS